MTLAIAGICTLTHQFFNTTYKDNDMTAEHPTWTLPIGDNGAALLMMPCPGTQDVTLDDTLSQLKQQGVSAILSVLSDDEMKTLNVEGLSDLCIKNDIQWFNLKVANGHVPSSEDMSVWQLYKDQIVEIINQGGKVAAHCKGGTGRTGLGVAMVLLELGWTPAKAIADVQSLKPKAFGHESAVEFIETMAATIEARA